MRTRYAHVRVLTLVLVTLVAAFARPGRAAAGHIDLGLGADSIEGGTGELNLTLGLDTWLAHRLTLGARFGAAFFGDGSHFGVPVDARLRVRLDRVYLEGLVGPWFIFDSGDLFHFHGAFGFGLHTGTLDFGLELGVLGRATMAGLRISFPI